MNIAAFLCIGLDKSLSENHMYRIRENELLLLFLCGGSFGGIAGMVVFRHKTRKATFLWRAAGLSVFNIGVLLISNELLQRWK